METQPSQPAILERIADLRQQLEEIAKAPEVLDLLLSGDYHPDLNLGDAIQALNELDWAIDEHFQTCAQKSPLVTLPYSA
ncbi:MAG: hypothetical protein KME46_21910 [Brasilonema angustatum HA4187-MV1]|jgi:hypothetical protein|nr:hypothetical protein [Brasilonema angustatum HA4187-MV1]